MVVYGLKRHVASCCCSRRSKEPGSPAFRPRTRRLVFCPLFDAGLYETLSLAVGARGVGSGAHVARVQEVDASTE